MKLSWRWPLLRRSPFVENARATVPSSATASSPATSRGEIAFQNATSTERDSVVSSAQNGQPQNGQPPDVARPSSTRFVNNGVTTRPFPHSLPKPALRWIGDGGRVALREFDFARDADEVCSWQQETYSLNFPDFRYTDSFSGAFRHDLRRGALDPHHAIFVLDDGQLLGFLWLVICENTWTGDRYGYVNNVYLLPSQRGHGLAREMMAHAERWFRSRGIKRARLTVTSSNAVACKLYESCGYETTRWEMEKEL